MYLDKLLLVFVTELNLLFSYNGRHNDNSRAKL